MSQGFGLAGKTTRGQKIFYLSVLSLALIVITFVALGRAFFNNRAEGTKSTNSQASSPATRAPNGNPALAAPEKGNHVYREAAYKGVKFTYHTSLSKEVKAETKPSLPLERADDKPDTVSPEHIAFSFVGDYASQHSSAFFNPEIHIYPISGYEKSLAVSKEQVRQLEEDVQKLRKILDGRPQFLTGEIPFLPYGVDATQAFHAHVSYVDFKNGAGIIFLTQYNIEPSLINNQGLFYTFQGLTNDGKYYVSATFPVSAPFLPKDFTEDQFEGYTLPTDSWGKDSGSNDQRYRAYLKDVALRLEALPPDQYEPDLTLFNEVVSSLEVAPE